MTLQLWAFQLWPFGVEVSHSSIKDMRDVSAVLTTDIKTFLKRRAYKIERYSILADSVRVGSSTYPWNHSMRDFLKRLRNWTSIIDSYSTKVSGNYTDLRG